MMRGDEPARAQVGLVPTPAGWVPAGRAWPWLLGCAAWGFAEATLFFLVPDILVAWVALWRPRQAIPAALAAAVGGLAGGILVFLLPGVFLPLMPHVPGISQAMLDSVGRDTASSGAWAMMQGPLSGVPYKLYAVQLGAQHQAWLPFVLLTIPARLERIIPVALLGILAGWALRRQIAARPRLTLVIYTGLWAVQYAVYLWRIAPKYAGT